VCIWWVGLFCFNAVLIETAHFSAAVKLRLPAVFVNAPKAQRRRRRSLQRGVRSHYLSVRIEAWMSFFHCSSRATDRSQVLDSET
jgi:hypothetical protein